MRLTRRHPARRLVARAPSGALCAARPTRSRGGPNRGATGATFELTRCHHASLCGPTSAPGLNLLLFLGLIEFRSLLNSTEQFNCRSRLHLSELTEQNVSQELQNRTTMLNGRSRQHLSELQELNGRSHQRSLLCLTELFNGRPRLFLFPSALLQDPAL